MRRTTIAVVSLALLASAAAAEYPPHSPRNAMGDNWVPLIQLRAAGARPAAHVWLRRQAGEADWARRDHMLVRTWTVFDTPMAIDGKQATEAMSLNVVDCTAGKWDPVPLRGEIYGADARLVLPPSDGEFRPEDLVAPPEKSYAAAVLKAVCG
jgi:hypothetical protein